MFLFVSTHDDIFFSSPGAKANKNLMIYSMG